MRVVFITFNGNNFDFKLLTFNFDQFFKSLLNIWYQKDFSSISWTKDKMVVYQRYSCVGMSICVFHVFIIHSYVYVVNTNIHIIFSFYIHIVLFFCAIHPTFTKVSFSHIFICKNVGGDTFKLYLLLIE